MLMRPDIKKALNFMLKIAMDDSHGYDQTHRNGPDYDCSSLIGTALNYAGFSVSPYSWTGNLAAQLLDCGFRSCGSPWKPGDIHLTPGRHVCMSVNPTEIVHARINELGKTTGGKPGDQTGNEISVSNYYMPSYGWEYHLRYMPKDTLNDAEIIARQVIAGRWGDGSVRIKKLTAAGYDYKKIQAIVNQLLNGYGKTNGEIAREVILGKWGDGDERAESLEAAGYNYKAVQKIVNLLLNGVKEG